MSLHIKGLKNQTLNLFAALFDFFSELLHDDVAECDTSCLSCLELEEYDNSKNLTQEINGMDRG